MKDSLWTDAMAEEYRDILLKIAFDLPLTRDQRAKNRFWPILYPDETKAVENGMSEDDNS